MDIILGIDPGKKGALWSINSAGTTGRWIDMPVLNKEINLNVLLDFLKLFDPKDTLVVIEKTFYTPVLRGRSGFSFGKAVMAVQACTVALGFKYEFAQPIKWKREYSLINKDKSASIDVAIRLNPDFRTQYLYQRGKITVKKDGRAEAFLIAEYGRRYFL